MKHPHRNLESLKPSLLSTKEKEEEKKPNPPKYTSEDCKRKADFALKTPNIKKKPPSQTKVSLSSEFKAQKILLSEDKLTAQGYKGYISIASNYPIIEGCYYFEVKILAPKLPLAYENQTPHVRIGICTKEFKCDYVLGSDAMSYSYRDIDGSVYHEGFSSPYGQSFSYIKEDVIGCLVYLKPPKPKSIITENIEDKQKFEEINQGSKIIFYKNGISQGLAFENIVQGFYYMGASLYNHAKVKFNFGPDFEFIPQEIDSEDALRKLKPASLLNEEEKRYKDVKIF